MSRNVLYILKVEKGSWGLEGCVKMYKVHQGCLGMKMMIGFVQETRGKVMRKVQKLGKICEGLWKTYKTCNRADGDGWFNYLLWENMYCKGAASQNTETE